jgi:predicted O-linked N-acetylglucosamine transferase (SPINDLY family)
MDQLDLRDWVIKTKEQYISTAEFMASDIAQLSSLRHNLRIKAQHTIFNAKKYTLELERAVETAWKDYVT